MNGEKNCKENLASVFEKIRFAPQWHLGTFQNKGPNMNFQNWLAAISLGLLFDQPVNCFVKIFLSFHIGF